MIQYKDLTAGPNFFLMAGPCAIEDEDTPLFIAERIVEMTTRLGIPYIFKGSYRKANRSRVDSFTGIGDEKALRILRRVRETFDIPVVTDIHETQEAALAAEYVDVLQIPRLPLPSDRSHRCSSTHGQDREHQEGAVPLCLGYGARRTQGHRVWQRPGHPHRAWQ